MKVEPWLPVGFRLPDGAKVASALWGELDWQIVATQGGGKALIAGENLAKRWLAIGLLDADDLQEFSFGVRNLLGLSSGPSRLLVPVSESRSPESRSQAMAFAAAMKASRHIDPESAFQDAVYVERFGRLLPTYSISSKVDDETVLGYWLTGGARVSARSFRRLSQMLSWISPSHLSEILVAAGVDPGLVADKAAAPADDVTSLEVEGRQGPTRPRAFSLSGRPKLETFFKEYVIDIIENEERYKELGIGFPSAIVLHGPPGCGKTFAVEKLVEYLGWPSFEVDASSVGSPYIHETSRKVAAIFERAIESSPSIIVIDEMEAFLADREMGSGGSHHRVEETAEFLRRIPEAVQSKVLIIAMTNRLEMIDKAILRRGRFDHLVEVGFAEEAEVAGLLQALLSTLPLEPDVDPLPLARKLARRPLSDVTFVVREGARLSARDGSKKLRQEDLLRALKSAPSRTGEEDQRRIGYI